VYRVCANSVDGRDSCPGRPHVPEKLARSILLNFVSQLLRSMPEWIDTAVREMNAAVQVYHEQLPTELKHSKAQLAVAEQRLEHLLQVAESGGAADVQSFGQRLKQAELEVNELRNDVERLKNVPPIPPQLPDKRWIASRLKKLAEAMAGDESNIAKLLGELIGSVRVYRVRLPGKKRGYHELRFRMNGWRVIRAAMQGTISREVLDVVESGVEASSCESPEVCLPVGGPTKLDVLAPQVAELRAQGMKWTEIGKLIGLSPDSAYQCWRRYTRACAAEEKRRRDAGDDSAQRDYGPGIREDDAAA